MKGIYTVPAIEDVLRRVPMDRRVNRLVLFGSHAKGTAREQSDLDFFLDSDKQIHGFAYFELKGRLEEAFEREVDLIPDIDVAPGSEVEREIQKYGVTVYAR